MTAPTKWLRSAKNSKFLIKYQTLGFLFYFVFFYQKVVSKLCQSESNFNGKPENMDVGIANIDKDENEILQGLNL